MKRLIKLLVVASVFSTLLLVNGCKKDSIDEPAIPRENIEETTSNDSTQIKAAQEQLDAGIAGLRSFSHQNDEEKTTVTPIRNFVEEGTNDYCREEEKDQLQIADDGVNNIIEPNVYLYPGIGLYGRDADRGLFAPILEERNPVKVSISLLTKEGSASSMILEDPNKPSDFTDVRNKLVRNVEKDVTPGVLAFKAVEAISEEQVAAELYLKNKSGFSDITSRIQFSKSEEIDQYILEAKQEFYKLTIDPTPRASLHFKGVPNISIFEGFKPVVVSSVSYGRAIYFSVTTKKTGKYAKAEIQSQFNGIFNSTNVDANVEYQSFFKNVTIQAIVLGGNATDAVKLISSPSELKSYLEKGAQFSIHNPGVPIGYTLSYMDDYSLARVGLATKYKVKVCTQCAPALKETTFFGGNGGSEFYLDIPECATIEHIDVAAGARVSYIAFWYREPGDEKLSVIKAGNPGKNLVKRFELEGAHRGIFKPKLKGTDRTVKHIYVKGGTRIDKIGFSYSDGTTEYYGGNGGHTDGWIKIPNGSKLAGFFGKAGAEIDQLGFYYRMYEK